MHVKQTPFFSLSGKGTKGKCKARNDFKPGVSILPFSFVEQDDSATRDKHIGRKQENALLEKGEDFMSDGRSQ